MVFLITLAVFTLFLILGGMISWIFIRGSKKHHPMLWQHAGEPTLMANGDLISAWPLSKYLMNRQYQEIEDQSAIVFAEKIRLPFLVIHFCSCASAIVFIAVIYFVGMPK